VIRAGHLVDASVYWKVRIDFMVVKARLGHGPVVVRRKGKNSRIAMLSASLLTLVAIGCASLGLWRMASDLEWAGDFVFPNGFLSHWQVWLGAAACVQYASLRMARYARTLRRREVEIARAAEPVADLPSRQPCATNEAADST
jgi:hypothetical protein